MDRGVDFDVYDITKLRIFACDIVGSVGLSCYFDTASKITVYLTMEQAEKAVKEIADSIEKIKRVNEARELCR